MINVWHEVCGYVIQSSRPRPTIVMMCGAGANGKTKLLDTLKRLLGPDAVCSSSINALESSRFATGGLVGKLLFVDDDVAVGAKLPDGTLKKLSEEKELTGERKFRDQFNFVNRAMPLLLCNNIPALSDLSHGMRRRLMVFEFKRIFADHEQDRGLFNRIWASELSGVLNRALQGWRRFVQNKHEFSASRDLVSGQKSVLNQANPLLTFIDEWCVKKPKASTPLKTLYEGFVRWADESGYRHKITRNTLKRNLEHLGYTFKRVNGIRLVSGIALKSIEVHSV